MSGCAETLVKVLTERGKRLVLAESCTAGLISDRIARVPGASKILWGAFVCYTAEAKSAMLGIDPAFIEKAGAVSGETARAMARGALEKSGADFAVSATGLAGPDGDERGTPVGTVWIGIASKPPYNVEARRFLFEGDRQSVRERAVERALFLLSEFVR